jgi:hypothetical protein
MSPPDRGARGGALGPAKSTDFSDRNVRGRLDEQTRQPFASLRQGVQQRRPRRGVFMKLTDLFLAELECS